ncbi:MAG TPA: hypothetical protein VG817_10925, partial [Gemmatimonadales bacterium]|nr:hypothetical protein [Gemmatimonadales bacterium]
YTAGNTSGYFVVIARSSNGKADTTDITIPTTAASISSIVVSPATATVASSATQQFTASAKLVGGSTLSNPEVTWSATGGTVNSSGRYTAGTTAGTYRVIARSSNGKADTSAVTVTGSAVTVTKVTLSPASVNLVAGGTQTFATQVTYSNGTTQTNPALTWSATGGTMGSGQTYTAGTVTGAYRVIATAANGKADTSVVNVTGVSSPPPSGANSMYFNSAEAGCGSDPNIILCDDFEDGDWYTKDADQANSSGGLLQTDGWSGTIYANPITPAKAAVCGSRGAKGTNCTATYGTLSGSQDSRNMADHEFNGGPVTELWARWYYTADAGYRWGAEKHTNFTKAAGDIAWFNIQFNCGAGSSQSSATPYVQIIHGNSHTCQPPNASSISLQSGTWYYFEVHLKLNSAGLNADGLIEIWINDCGANGVCTGSPTLRTRMTNVSFDRNQSGCKTSPCKIETLWFENWANPKSAGTSYLDQIKVSKAGMIGF